MNISITIQLIRNFVLDHDLLGILVCIGHVANQIVKDLRSDNCCFFMMECRFNALGNLYYNFNSFITLMGS